MKRGIEDSKLEGPTEVLIISSSTVVNFSGNNLTKWSLFLLIMLSHPETSNSMTPDSWWMDWGSKFTSFPFTSYFGIRSLRSIHIAG